ncbi:MAG: hypothetical protein OXC03_03450 [Flavobacteriaceae bacterium]|nr:hypothetical protein [Flavobacteriaceae bacterium]
MFEIDSDLTEVKDLFSKRLKKARLLYGISQDDLVQFLDSIDAGISKEELIQYEHGLALPNSTKLIELANSLKLKFGYFFRPITIKNADIQFRKNISLQQEESNSLKERVAESLERYAEIEYHLKQNNPEYCLSSATDYLPPITDSLSTFIGFSNPIKNETIDSFTDINKVVYTLLNAWELGYNGLPNVIKIIEDKGIKILEFHQYQSINALSGWVNKTTPFIVIKPRVDSILKENEDAMIGDSKLLSLGDNSSNEYTFDDLEELMGIAQGYEQKRFFVLRELGYLLLNFSPEITDKKKEDLCSEFAAAMLMPYKIFMKEVGNKRKYGIRIGELRNIKKIYGIPIHVVIDRARRLEIITETEYLRFKKSVSLHISDLIDDKKAHEGQAPSAIINVREEQQLKKSVYYTKYKEDKVEHPIKFMQLVYKAVDDDVISMSKGAGLCNEKAGYFREHYMHI